jgi:hypothetical protein
MAKLHVEIDGPILRPGAISIIKDGAPLSNVAYLGIHLDGESIPIQAVTLGQVVVVDGQPCQSDVSHTITKATISLEYTEA